MLYYEKGIAINQNNDAAFDLYQKIILNHPFPGEEEMNFSLKALSRMYRQKGLSLLGGGGGDETSRRQYEEMATKYEAFAMSNPETQEELQDVDNWWTNQGGRESYIAQMMSS